MSLRRQPKRSLVLCAAAAALACTPAPRPGTPTPGDATRGATTSATGGDWLYAWSASADTAHPAAFLAEFDLRDGSPTAGQLVRVVPTGPGAQGTHHSEHALASDGLLFANDFGAGRSFIFDLTDPANPRIKASFTTAGPFGWPHSYVRLANGNRLVTYQWQAAKFDSPPGGIAEVRTDGTIVRWASARSADAPDREITPYSLEVLPAMDRVVTTSTSMVDDFGVHVQVWRLSDLALLHTVPIPGGHAHGMSPSDTMPHHLFPGEPRVLADGRTVMLGTFTCGLYTITGIDGAAPRVTPVYSFPGKDCAVPVRLGRYWLQTVPALHAVVTLDVSEPANPREVSRLVLGDEVTPHWLASDLSGRRLVMDAGSNRNSHLYLMQFDPATGAVSRDGRFPVLDMSSVDVPGVGIVRGVPHGAVFSR